MIEEPTREERDLLVLELTANGLTAKQISNRLKISDRTVVRIRNRNTKYIAPEPISKCEIQRAKDMLEEGVSYTEVARTLGRCVKAVKKRVPGYPKWTKFEASQYSVFVRSLNKLV